MSIDNEMVKLSETILSGWLDEKKKCSVEIEEYWNYIDEMTVVDGVIFKGTRVLIPPSLRKLMLLKIHVGHLGLEKCKRRAQQVLFWPRINQQIDELVSKCSVCITNQTKQQSEPLLPHPVVTREWEKVATDLFDFEGDDYLVVADYYSYYIEVDKLSSTNGRQVVKGMKEIFSRWGMPEYMFSDNGPCYTSGKFAQFV